MGNFFSSVTAPFRWSDDESGNPYTGMAADESGSRMQDFYDRNGGSMGSIFSSTAANFGWGGSKASSFGQQSQSTPFFRTMTPSFLWDDDDDDLRTTCCPNMSLKKRIFGCVCLLMVGQLLQATGSSLAALCWVTPASSRPCTHWGTSQCSAPRSSSPARSSSSRKSRPRSGAPHS